MTTQLIDIAFTVFIIAFVLCIIVLVAGMIWYCFLEEWWEERKKLKVLRIEIDLKTNKVNSPEGIKVEAFKVLGNQKLCLIIHEK